jgi:integrase
MQAKLTNALVKSMDPGAQDVNITDALLPGFELRIRPSGVRAFAFRYRILGGRQQRLRLGNYPALSADEARKRALMAAADVANGIDVVARQRAERANAARVRASTLKAFLDEQYEPWAVTHLRTASFQLKRIRSDFKEWLDMPMVEMDPVLIERWRAVRVRAGNKPVTINRNLQRLRALVGKAVEWKAIDRHPFCGLKPLKHDRSGRVRYLDEEEEQQLRDALLKREDKLRKDRERFNAWRIARHKAPLPLRTQEYVDHLRPIVLLALNTGLRRGELLALMWKDVNMKTKWITVAGQTSKNNQTRRVPLNAEAAAILEGWNRQSKGSLTGSYVFAGSKGKRMTAITTAWRSLRRMARLRNFHFHDLRHHFASRLVQSGVDLNSVRELLGHSDIKMVLRYAHLAPEGLAKAVEKIARTDVNEESEAA